MSPSSSCADTRTKAGRKLGLPGIEFAESAEHVADKADALVIVTEWDEFRALDLTDIAGRMRGKLLIDLRNIYDRRDAEEAGLAYRGVGRGRA